MDKIYQYEPLWGDWSIDEKIGEGSFGQVYRIKRESATNTYYAAVKIITIPQNKSEINNLISEGMDADSLSNYFQEVLEGLVDEIDLLYSFRGLSNIVNIDDYKVIKNDDGITHDILIKMELLKDISTYNKENPLNKAEVLKLALDLCKALETCHKKSIIHRDIKPDNIFISEHGDYKLGDFGVARRMEKTLSGLSKKGTYLYMAPEVYKGEDYDLTVDIYSLGIVLYRYLNKGMLPFLSSSQVMFKQREEALSKRMSGQPVPFPLSGSGDFEQVVLRACSYKKEDRFQDAQSFRKALEAVILDQKDLFIVSETKINSQNTSKTEKATQSPVFDKTVSINEQVKEEIAKVIHEHMESGIGTDVADIASEKTEVINSKQDNTEIIDEQDRLIRDNLNEKLSDIEASSGSDQPQYSGNSVLTSKKKSRSRIMLASVFALIITSIFGYFGYQSIFKDEIQYSKAIADLENGNYEEAKQIFERLVDYKETQSYLKEARYLIGKEYFETGNFQQALVSFKFVRHYKDSEVYLEESNYQVGLELFSGQKYQEAFDIFETIDISHKETKKYYFISYNWILREKSNQCLTSGGLIFTSTRNNINCQNTDFSIDFGTYESLKDTYLELIKYENDQSLGNSLSDPIYFVLRNEGTWLNSAKTIGFTIYPNSSGYIMNYSGFTMGDSIDDYVSVSQDTLYASSYQAKVLKFTIIDENTMDCYIYPKKTTYRLFKQN
jgi:serine/threonine protein kinase